MPSQSDSDAGRRLIVAAGTEHFPGLGDDFDLEKAPEELERIATAFTSLGYERLPIKLDPSRDELRILFSTVKEDSRRGDFVVAYYTGHGAKDEEEHGRFYLLTNESNLNKLDDTSLPAEDLARALIKKSNASQVLLILDCCYAAAGAAEVAQIAGRLVALGGEGPEIFVLAAARTKQEADSGAFSSALAETLKDERLGGRAQAYLAIDEVTEAINDYLRDKHPSQVARWQANAEGRCRIFPNPRHLPNIRPGLDLETQRAFGEHWVPKARGAEVGAGGWYFTGREQALRELTAWLWETSSGGKARVVTGGPGCGKSAVLARIVTLSNPAYRREVLSANAAIALDTDTLPPEGVVSVAVHARHKLLADILEQIAGGLSLSVLDPVGLVNSLASRPGKTVIVVDALDESDEKELIVSKLLSGLAVLPTVFLLVGTRPDSTKLGRRYSALGDSTVEVDLDEPRYIGVNDVALYVERRLLATEEPGRATPYRDLPAVAHTVAQAVSERANNVFLIARTAVISLLDKSTIVDTTDSGWIEKLPTGLDDAFAQFLSQLNMRKPGGLSSAMVRAVLLPLAFAEGEGLPWSDIWATMATALADAAVSDFDIQLVRKYAAAFIVEALEQERSVYRLYHELVAEYLRGLVADPQQAHQRIAKALRESVPKFPASNRPDWMRAHPYLLAHLSAHFLKAGSMDMLAADGLFLSCANPLRILRDLSASIEPLARRAADCYSLAFDRLLDQRPDARLSYLEMIARQQANNALADLWTVNRHPLVWAVPWARWSPATVHRVIPAGSSMQSIALGTLEGRSAIISGGRDGAVRVWDLATGEALGELLRSFQHTSNDLVNLSTGMVYGQRLRSFLRTIIASVGLSSGEAHEELLHGHVVEVSAVALGTLEGRAVIVLSGGWDGTVRVWDLATGEAYGEPLCGHVGEVSAVALGTLEGRAVIVLSGGWDGTVRVWDLATGEAHVKPLRGHVGEVSAVALGTIEGWPVIVSGGRDGTVRVWDLATGEAYGEPLCGHVGEVSAVALGTIEGRAVVVSSGGNDRTLRVWELTTSKVHKEPLLSHVGEVSAVALSTLKGWSVIVSGGRDGAVRVWDLATGEAYGKPLRGHVGKVSAVALSTLKGWSVIVSGGRDGTVRVWDLATGKADGEPLRSHDGEVSAIALGTLEGRAVIVSGGRDGAVRVWDLAIGEAHGELLRSFQHTSNDLVNLSTGMVYGQRLRSFLRTIIASVGLSSGEAHEELLHGHVVEVSAVALGTLEGQPVIVSGRRDGTVRVRYLATGKTHEELLHGHVGEVSAVALGTLEGQPVIVSGGRDGTVRVWSTKGVALTAIHIGSSINCIAFAEPGNVAIGANQGLMLLRLEMSKT